MDHKYKLDLTRIAQRIKSARRAAGLTQAELAERIDISTNAVAKLENELMAPSLMTLVNTANALGIDINYLLTDETPFSDESSQDRFLASLLHGLSSRDKDFIIHVINGLRLYHTGEAEKKP